MWQWWHRALYENLNETLKKKISQEKRCLETKRGETNLAHMSLLAMIGKKTPSMDHFRNRSMPTIRARFSKWLFIAESWDIGLKTGSVRGPDDGSLVLFIKCPLCLFVVSSARRTPSKLTGMLIGTPKSAELHTPHTHKHTHYLSLLSAPVAPPPCGGNRITCNLIISLSVWVCVYPGTKVNDYHVC